MQNSLENLNAELSYWDNLLDDSSFNHYDFAFFRIFVKLELFFVETFKNYALGNPSPSGFMPDRKLEFEDLLHLDNMLKNRRASFIEYFEVIESKSKYIFNNNKDPFSLIFNDVNLSNYMKKFKIIRNYIAHESSESKKKYKKDVLCSESFISVNDFFVKKVKNVNKSNYTIYIEKINEIKEIIYEPSPYF